MTYKEAYEIAMPEAKRKEEKMNIWVTLVVRPISVLMASWFVNTKVKPITITKISILASLIGSVVFSVAPSMEWKLFGWFLFFVWAVLDGVDGNLARCQNCCSAMGDLWDTMGGYAAMVLIYFSAGIVACYDDNFYTFCDGRILLIIGGITALASIFPRLILHKKKSSNIESSAVKDLTNKQGFSLSKIFAMNLVSPSGFMQVVFLVAILSHTLNFFILFYMIVNIGIMTLSLRKLLKTE